MSVEYFFLKAREAADKKQQEVQSKWMEIFPDPKNEAWKYRIRYDYKLHQYYIEQRVIHYYTRLNWKLRWVKKMKWMWKPCDETGFTSCRYTEYYTDKLSAQLAIDLNFNYD